MFICEPCAKDRGIGDADLMLALRSRGPCEMGGPNCIVNGQTYDIHHSRLPPLPSPVYIGGSGNSLNPTVTVPSGRIIPPLVWLDCETTGLSPGRNKLLEIGMIATDGNLEEFEGVPRFSEIINPHKLDLMQLDPVIVAMHTASGLLADLRSHSLVRQAVEEGARKWLSTLKSHTGADSFVMAGSTIDFDRRFFASDFPDLMTYFHYRTVNVSSVKELVRRWYGEEAVFQGADPKPHRVMPDLVESIAELRYYRTRFALPLTELEVMLVHDVLVQFRRDAAGPGAEKGYTLAGDVLRKLDTTWKGLLA